MKKLRPSRISRLCSIAFLFAGALWASESSGRVELSAGWRLASVLDAPQSGEMISTIAYDVSHWHVIARMPATVLEVLQEDGVYPNLYFGMNLLESVPQDLYKQDWWYRTEFELPRAREVFWLELPGINYRAEIWINGKRIANSNQVAGMYVAHQFDISANVHPGEKNVLAIKVIPERAIPNLTGVELGDSWHDWLEWEHLGSQIPKSDHYKEGWTADRNAGIWKPVYLHATGPVKLSGGVVNSEVALPSLDSARLTVYSTVSNVSGHSVTGVLSAVIRREGKPEIRLEKSVTLEGGQESEIVFSPSEYPALLMAHPDLWWPYTMGPANLYQLHFDFRIGELVSDDQSLRFGIRTITPLRDRDLRFSRTSEGNFYLQINGKDFHARGADYTPDLLFRRDPERDIETIRYVKDLGLNMLRWELKIADEHMFELADEAGIPVMAGWMCCSKWEQWEQWSEEDQRIARSSMRSQIWMLRSHPSVVLWSNGSDGRPPEPLRTDYRNILRDLHWQNAIVDTDSNGNHDEAGRQQWDGIGMTGVDRWHPPSYWFMPEYPAASGSSAEYGDNEVIPPFESLKKFIPHDKLWPINEYWFFHAGAHEGAHQLSTIRTVVDRRYGPSTGAEEFARKAQLAHYENVRAQFEDWAASDWSTHKMEMYWMLNNHWPSFFGHLFDYYMEPGGGYFGAKKALRPLSVVFDYYATGKHETAKVTITNQELQPHRGLEVRVRIYDVSGVVRYDKLVKDKSVQAQGAAVALEIPRPKNISDVFFVRCELLDGKGTRLAENVYWQSSALDDPGDPQHDDDDYVYDQKSWADFTSLNKMPRVDPRATATVSGRGDRMNVEITLHNPTRHVAFFERASVLAEKDGDEILPIVYSDNYVTIFPGETATLNAEFARKSAEGRSPWLRLEGYNTSKIEVPLLQTEQE